MTKILQDIDLHPYNTFHLHCTARDFVTVASIQDIHSLIQGPITTQTKILILGGGSNILLQDQIFDGLVIKNEIMGKEIVAQDETSVTIKVGAGENRDNFVRRSIEQLYTGIEQLVSIPGCVGASPMQNIGAYGVEVKNVITEVEYIYIGSKTDFSLNKDGLGEMCTLSNQECNFGYRESIFKHELKNKVIITHVTFKLGIYTKETYDPNISYGAIKEKLDITISPDGLCTPKLLASTIADIRASKLPDWTKLGTAGSFFKNPYISSVQFEQLQKDHPEIKGRPIENSTTSKFSHSSNSSNLPMYKLSAGQLIDLAGLKGYRAGDAGTYEKHALVLINHKNARGEDLVAVARYIQKTVRDKFGVRIEMEVNLV